jgi:dTDP-4-dehydrorhamnose reductase
LERQRPGNAAGDVRPVVVLGAAGQLGQTIAARFAAEWPVVPLTRADLDLRSSAAVSERLRALQPCAIVNCAGYNQVDEAEDHAFDALESNAFIVRTLARTATTLGAALVHYSSDFVFDGASTRPYREDDPPNPRSVYAASKLLGEWFAADADPHYVLRVESLFGGLSRRKGSLEMIITTLESGGITRAFKDRVVSPSYVWDVADATAALLQRRPSSGVYHCVNSGAATWLEVAEEIRRQLGSRATIEAITMSEAGTLRAPRPAYCALSNDKLRSVGVVMPTWQDALARELVARKMPSTPVTSEKTH